MDNRAKKLLFDVLESGRSILGWCEGRTFADYESDRQFRRAVEREFEVIGEALGRLATTDSEVAARIGHLPRIVASAIASSMATTPSTMPRCGA